ncbi:glycerol-3-phosphate responsive antiterminator [Oceanobacillus sp. J11TS1]|uniref:glycerol-3-phosphate responsive antiterminator n=1 Tax=Oceanobacillus sp. J11TS1 TaxID=2807191 RepID=UPI001B07F1A8|nr:glycerol-3-phosphate responsive antiterminator [Oceanobacillus sp. J11TS1]GIO24656.1 glycerol uptake operon antiterminator regulatory protein [Oceanobacillus sp. J11TS1]
MENIVNIVESQIIASVKSPEHLRLAADSNSNVVFLLTGDLLSTANYLDVLKEARKETFLHIDFIEGLSNSKNALEYIAKAWKPKGIITTRNSLIKYAKEEGLMTIQRIFLIDKNAMNKGIEMAAQYQPDAIEILPGLMPSVIDELTRRTNLPIIAGGLISKEKEILEGLEAGALAISSSDPELWNIDV